MWHKRFFLISILFFLLASCQKPPRGADEIYIGTISGPETELMEVAQKVAAEQYHLKIKIFEFEDYTMPNTALSEGSLDANLFQHQPYLDLFNQQRGLHLVAIGKMFVYPMAIYSKKYPRLHDLPQGAKIGIPNDPSNEARALKLLQKANLITLDKADDLHLTPHKILKNPKQLKFQEVTSAQLPRALDDLDAACINTNYALTAGLSPLKDGLFHEGADSPYVNILVVQEADKDNPKFQLLLKALHSKEVLEKAHELFGEHALKGW